MNFGSYIKSLREENKLSQRELAEKSGVSNAEISRLETGGRKKPSPMVLKALSPYLGVPYEMLMQQAGYIEENIEHPGYIENIYRDEKGFLVDIITRAKDMYKKTVNGPTLPIESQPPICPNRNWILSRPKQRSFLNNF